MRKVVKIALVIVAILLLSGNNLWAAIVTIDIVAEITHIYDPGGIFNGQLDVGGIITGSYTYGLDTPDTNPLLDVGDYDYYSAPYGVNLNAGGFVFQTDPDNVNFYVEVGNNHIYSTEDHYLFRSYSNLPLSNGVIVDLIDWQLYDDSGTALSSDALPTTPPILEHWHSYAYGLHITFGYKGYLSSIGADVTSAIPEPATIFLLGLGSIALLRKRKP